MAARTANASLTSWTTRSAMEYRSRSWLHLAAHLACSDGLLKVSPAACAPNPLMELLLRPTTTHAGPPGAGQKMCASIVQCGKLPRSCSTVMLLRAPLHGSHATSNTCRHVFSCQAACPMLHAAHSMWEHTPLYAGPRARQAKPRLHVLWSQCRECGCRHQTR